MNALIPATCLAFLVCVPTATAQAAPKKPASQHFETLNAADLKWGAAPPGLPRGAQMAVLHGDPTKDVQFALRLKLPDGYKIPPHWHTKDELLTILSGTFVLHMGDTMTAPAYTLNAGGFHYLPGRMHHAAVVRGETILQINGIGPFDIHYLNPGDDPRKTTPGTSGQSGT
ncbi:Cupin domain protein [compost metagenome]